MEKTMISTWAEKTNLYWPKSKKLTMEIDKIYMKMEEEDMRSYLEQAMSNLDGRSSQNSRLKFWAQMGKKFQMICNFWIFYYL